MINLPGYFRGSSLAIHRSHNVFRLFIVYSDFVRVALSDMIFVWNLHDFTSPRNNSLDGEGERKFCAAARSWDDFWRAKKWPPPATIRRNKWLAGRLLAINLSVSSNSTRSPHHRITISMFDFPKKEKKQSVIYVRFLVDDDFSFLFWIAIRDARTRRRDRHPRKENENGKEQSERKIT